MSILKFGIDKKTSGKMLRNSNVYMKLSLTIHVLL